MAQKHEDPENLEKIESSLTKAEQYIEDNQKKLTYIVGIIVVVIAAFFIYKSRVAEPREAEAVDVMWEAQRYFEQDSFHIALYGNANVYGFEYVIDKFGATESGNLAHYYAGICYLHMKEYDNAIDLLKEYSPNEDLLAQTRMSLLGDAYSNKEQYEKAAKNYEKAADISESVQFSPLFLIKAGQCYEKLEQYDKALKVYTRIKNEFGDSDKINQVEKYIVRVKSFQS
ncbi:MAG: tetratricopeptide repeat protein [Bacteroidales bacterium]